MSLKLEKIAWSLPMTDSCAKMLLVAMCHVSETGDVWIDPIRLQSMTGMAERTIRRKKSDLMKAGFIRQTGVNQYQITFSETASQAVPPASQAVPPASQAAKTASQATSYIGTERTEVNGGAPFISVVADRREFLEAAEMGGVPREFAEGWYNRHEETGSWINRHGHLMPFAKSVSLMVRRMTSHYRADEQTADGREKPYDRRNRVGLSFPQ